MERKSVRNKNFVLMIIDLQDNKKISPQNFTPIRAVEDSLIEEALRLGFKESFALSYGQIAEAMIFWIEEGAKETTTDYEGATHILSLDGIIGKRSSSNFDPQYLDDDDARNDFHVVDEFCNEAGVGIFSGKSATNSLYFFAIDEMPEYLGLDLSGYVEMLIASRCYRYWQKAILSIRNEKTNHETEKFKERMPYLFPGWTWESFVSKYNEVKIEEDAF